MCATKHKLEAQNPLILRCHRLMDSFAKSDDERDFYIDRQEGFLIYVDLDKSQAELDALEYELKSETDRYCSIPKLSYYETKKIMEGFVNEKVYDIDTKEKLLDIIQSKEARENFLEFIYDHHSELEKWQQFYQERSRIRIIEWLRQNHFHFVFEEDLDLPKGLIEKLKQSLFQAKVSKEILLARKALVTKAKTYYSNEALNPRPKRGRPPKQAAKQDIEPQVTVDIYTTVEPAVRPFLYSPELNSASPFSAFSSKFHSEEELLANRRQALLNPGASLTQKLASLRSLSSRWVKESPTAEEVGPYAMDNSFNGDDDDEFEDEDDDYVVKPPKQAKGKAEVKPKEIPSKKKEPAPKTTNAKPPKKKSAVEKVKRIIPQEPKGEKPQRRTALKKIMPKKKP